MILVKNLEYRRDDKIILQNLSFAVQSGSGLVITGANGTGKTTVLKILAGLLVPTLGKIERPEDILYIGHKNAMKEEFSVLENLKFWAGLAGNELLVPAALSYFQLEDYMDLPHKALSHGLQRRVALARLILSPRETWLLDEPFAHIDNETAKCLRNLIITRTEQGGIVILSSHQPVDLPFGELGLGSGD